MRQTYGGCRQICLLSDACWFDAWLPRVDLVWAFPSQKTDDPDDIRRSLRSMSDAVDLIRQTRDQTEQTDRILFAARRLAQKAWEGLRVELLI